MESSYTVTGGNENMGFIYAHWDLINFTVLGLAFIAVILAIYSKDSVKMKIINVLVIVFIPVIGILYFYGRLLFVSLHVRYLRRNQ